MSLRYFNRDALKYRYFPILLQKVPTWKYRETKVPTCELNVGNRSNNPSLKVSALDFFSYIVVSELQEISYITEKI